MSIAGARVVSLSLFLSLAGGVAWADPSDEAALDHALRHPAPGPGLERARVGSPGWCGHLADRDDAWAATLTNQLQELHDSNAVPINAGDLAAAARTVCTAPSAPVAQRAAAEILQLWINATGMSAADATASLAARFDADAFEAAQTALCDGPLREREHDDDDDDDRSGAVHVSKARRDLVGCDGGSPLWQTGRELDELTGYVDRGAVEQDPLAHAAWMIYRGRKAVDPGERPERALLGYVIDQFDLHAITPDEVRRLADTAPYKGNRYARAVLLESAGALGLAVARYEAAVAAKTRDPSWKELLVTVPQQGAAAWLAAAKKHADALARSDAFAKTKAFAEARGGRTTRGIDCEKQLDPDVLAIAKGLPHGNVATLRHSLSDDAVVGLLVRRLIYCRIAAGDQWPGEMLRRLALRVVGGPRMAAYYAVIDSGAAERASVKLSSLPSPTGRDESDEHDEADDDTGNDGGVIASVGKTGGAMHVAYVQKHVRYMSQKCVETNKADRILPDGTIVYRTACHDAGMVDGTEGPQPVDVPVQYAAQLQPGRYVAFSRAFPSWPMFVFSDASRKHLVAFAGFPVD